jgi:hypothetical protein
LRWLALVAVNTAREVCKYRTQYGGARQRKTLGPAQRPSQPLAYLGLIQS